MLGNSTSCEIRTTPEMNQSCQNANRKLQVSHEGASSSFINNKSVGGRSATDVIETRVFMQSTSTPTKKRGPDQLQHLEEDNRDRADDARIAALIDPRVVARQPERQKSLQNKSREKAGARDLDEDEDLPSRTAAAEKREDMETLKAGLVGVRQGRNARNHNSGSALQVRSQASERLRLKLS